MAFDLVQRSFDSSAGTPDLDNWPQQKWCLENSRNFMKSTQNIPKQSCSKESYLTLCTLSTKIAPNTPKSAAWFFLESILRSETSQLVALQVGCHPLHGHPIQKLQGRLPGFGRATGIQSGTETCSANGANGAPARSSGKQSCRGRTNKQDQRRRKKWMYLPSMCMALPWNQQTPVVSEWS